MVAIFVSYISRQFSLDVPAQWTALAALMAAWTVVSIPTYSRLRKRFGGTELLDDIKRNMVRVEHYDVDQVIEMREYEDLGSAYFIRDREGVVHFLMGQYFYEAEEGGLFPTTRLEIVRAPLSGIVLNLKCSGRPLKPVKTIGPFREELVRQGKMPRDGGAISVGWDDIEKTYA
jgi:hypothetical protein